MARIVRVSVACCALLMMMQGGARAASQDGGLGSSDIVQPSEAPEPILVRQVGDEPVRWVDPLLTSVPLVALALLALVWLTYATRRAAHADAAVGQHAQVRPNGLWPLDGWPISDPQKRLHYSIGAVEDYDPVVSARIMLDARLRTVSGAACVLCSVALLTAPALTVFALNAVVVATYCAAIVYRVRLTVQSTKSVALARIPDERARALRDDELPVYTILIPAYREPESVAQVLRAVERIDYPPDLLDVKLLLEADDHETHAAAVAAGCASYVEVVRVPPGEPRTKPKACNYGLGTARGELVTIYDCEDIPDPLQLRRAVAAFTDSGPDVACLQAGLRFYNPRQNLLTKWFALDYGLWFRQMLPGLVTSAAPVPLGGTSNHLHTDVLRAVGGWDPFNVTEDADLGVRLARAGFGVRALDSWTDEEATSDVINWLKQRSRWYKGYLQTLLVHLRDPRLLIRQVGWPGVAQFILFVGGTPVLAILNVVVWMMTIAWFVAEPPGLEALFPGPVYYPALAAAVFGNFACVYLAVVAVRDMEDYDLLWAALTVPLYWLLMSVAAWKALVQLVIDPAYWEKTVHGLHTGRATEHNAGAGG